MYFIELLIKKFSKKNDSADYSFKNQEQIGEYENCEHQFMPIDSTGETLSCINCGLVVQKQELKSKNFFMR